MRKSNYSFSGNLYKLWLVMMLSTFWNLELMRKIEKVSCELYRAETIDIDT